MKDSSDKKMVAADTARRQPAAGPVKNDTLPPKKSIVNNANKKQQAAAGQRPPATPVPAAGDKERQPLSLHYGLLWNVNIPLQGFSNYFTGTNAKSQPYNVLIPGIWVSLVMGDKHELSLMARPAQQYFAHKATLTAVRDSVSVADSTPAMTTTALVKTSGAAVAFLYHYHITEKLVVGEGIQYNWMGSALVSRQQYRISDNRLLYDSTFGIKKTDPYRQLLKSSFITGRAELAYQAGSLRIGLSVVVPLTNISAAAGVNIRTPNELLFLRWDIGRLFRPQSSTD